MAKRRDDYEVRLRTVKLGSIIVDFETYGDGSTLISFDDEREGTRQNEPSATPEQLVQLATAALLAARTMRNRR